MLLEIVKDSAVQNNLLSKAEYALRMAKKIYFNTILDENIELIIN